MCNPPLRSSSSMEVVDSARDLHMCGDMVNDSTKTASTLRVRARPDATTQKHSNAAAYTWKQIALHNTIDDAWVVIKGKVYDVTHFGRQHPGGNVIYKFAGRDATDAFSAFHSPTAWSMMRKYAVGTLEESEQQDTSPVIADFRALRNQLLTEGMFRASAPYYVFKTASTFALFVAAYALLWTCYTSFLAVAASAALLGLAMQQAGWLAHDYLHNQVFKARRLNMLVGYVFGNVLQGFSVHWWRNKHNTHHAVPNEVGEQGDAHDPDIDTLPYLAWSEEQLVAARARNAPLLGLVRYQHHLLWPLLAFARMIWAQQSAAAAMAYAATGSLAGLLEVVLLIAHYGIYLYVPFSRMSLLAAASWALGVQVVGGLLLGYVFVQSHNGMEVYSDAKDFATAQLVSTRNVAPGLWNDWFTGGLNYQIEHHLFPSMPRHNYRKIAGRVRELCAKHDLPYECVSMGQAIKLVVGHLRSIAKLA